LLDPAGVEPATGPRIRWSLRSAVDCLVKSLRAVPSCHGEGVQPIRPTPLKTAKLLKNNRWLGIGV